MKRQKISINIVYPILERTHDDRWVRWERRHDTCACRYWLTASHSALWRSSRSTRAWPPPRALPHSKQPLPHNKLQFYKRIITAIHACTVYVSDTFRTHRLQTAKLRGVRSQECVVRLRFRCNTSGVGAYFISISLAALPPTEGHIPRAAI